MRQVFAVLALGAMLVFPAAAGFAQGTAPVQNNPNSPAQNNPNSAPGAPSPAPTTPQPVTTPEQTPSAAPSETPSLTPGQQQTPPAVQPQQAPIVQPSAPAPAPTTYSTSSTTSNEGQDPLAPPKETIIQQCYWTYGSSGTMMGGSNTVPPAEVTAPSSQPAQGGLNEVLPATNQASTESGFSPRFCGGWAGSPGAGYFPKTPDIGVPHGDGVEMSPNARLHWENAHSH